MTRAITWMLLLIAAGVVIALIAVALIRTIGFFWSLGALILAIFIFSVATWEQQKRMDRQRSSGRPPGDEYI